MENRNFVLHPSLSLSPRARLAPNWRSHVILILFFLMGSVGGFFLVFFEGGTVVDKIDVHLGSEPVLGQSIGKGIEWAESTPYYRIDYRYDTDGTSVEGRDYVDTEKEYDSYWAGKPITVYRAKLDHKASALSARPHILLPLVTGVVVLGASICGVYLIVNSSRELYRSQTCVREGRPVQGDILGMTGQSTDGGYMVTLRYAFISPGTHKEITAARAFVREDLKNEELPQAGHITVLYVDDNTYLPV